MEWQAEDSKETLRQKCTRYEDTPLRDGLNASKKDNEDKERQEKSRSSPSGSSFRLSQMPGDTSST